LLSAARWDAARKEERQAPPTPNATDPPALDVPLSADRGQLRQKIVRYLSLGQSQTSCGNANPKDELGRKYEPRNGGKDSHDDNRRQDTHQRLILHRIRVTGPKQNRRTRPEIWQIPRLSRGRIALSLSPQFGCG
jgi:hypothetical protein